MKKKKIPWNRICAAFLIIILWSQLLMPAHAEESRYGIWCAGCGKRVDSFHAALENGMLYKTVNVNGSVIYDDSIITISCRACSSNLLTIKSYYDSSNSNSGTDDESSSWWGEYSVTRGNAAVDFPELFSYMEGDSDTSDSFRVTSTDNVFQTSGYGYTTKAVYMEAKELADRLFQRIVDILPVAGTSNIGKNVRYRITDGDFTWTEWYDSGKTDYPADTQYHGLITYLKKFGITAARENSYHVSFAANGGEGSMEAMEAEAGIPFSLPNCGYEKTGHNFAGWALAADGQAVYQAGDSLEVKGDMELYAVWTPIQYEISCIDMDSARNKELGRQTMIRSYGEEVRGSDFGKESPYTGYTYGSDTMTLAGKDHTVVYRYFSPVVYAVMLEAYDGVIESPLNSYAYGEETRLPERVNKKGYTFLGWYDNADYQGEPVVTLGREEYGDKTFYARWEQNRYGILVEGARDNYRIILEKEGQESQDMTACHGDLVKLVLGKEENRQFAGFLFSGGAENIQESPEEMEVTFTMPDGQVVIYTYWKECGSLEVALADSFYQKYGTEEYWNGSSFNLDTRPAVTVENDMLTVTAPIFDTKSSTWTRQAVSGENIRWETENYIREVGTNVFTVSADVFGTGSWQKGTFYLEAASLSLDSMLEHSGSEGYPELKEFMEGLEAEIKAHQKEIEELKKEIEKSAEQEAAYQEKILALQKEMENLKNQLETAQREYEKKQKELEKAYQENTEKLNEEILKYKEKMEGLKEQLSEKQKELVKLKEEQKEKLRELENQLIKAAEKKEELIKLIEDKEKQLKELISKESSNQEYIDSLKKQLAAIKAENQQELSGLKKENHTLEEKIASLEKALKASENAVKELTALKDQLSEAKKREDALREQLAHAGKQETVLKEQLSGAEKQETALKEQLKGSQMEEAGLRDKLAATEKELEALKAERTAIEKENLSDSDAKTLLLETAIKDKDTEIQKLKEQLVKGSDNQEAVRELKEALPEEKKPVQAGIFKGPAVPVIFVVLMLLACSVAGVYIAVKEKEEEETDFTCD